ncbi:PQQ-binding-like beta-propeller repeat protein [Flagellimonas meridianipacifica]|uniref:Quinoprotein glucose dehydrogenase n=1 Tax=Flagellimonas meridianipacifica TaxID=1080225 RepID=A0A2T0MHI1_9FLAO|nr:PQQ-binding-like beta-propeller repeat protein [Allomuricauda pacifica]PRX57015.1 quinoprotein glucose dehydrogenase [Allomuricauda pacifica]
MLIHRPLIRGLLLPLLLSLAFIAGCSKQKETSTYETWSTYLGDKANTHFTTLNEIDSTNVSSLKIAWEYESEDFGQMQMNPIVVDTLLYGVTAALRVVALHAATGEQVWQFGEKLEAWHSTSRGVTYWSKGEDKRILFTRGSQLWALNALTGEPISSFGNKGSIDLRSGLPDSAKEKFVISNTPGIIHEDKIIMPLRVSEDIGAAPGNLMALNVETGALAWVFHTIPLPEDPAYKTWKDEESIQKGHVGGANNWAGMALDAENEILYVPTGSAAPDFYGGIRKGENLYANSLLALDVNTGNLLWHFQFTHHDVWDRDPPAPPNLMMLSNNGKSIPAVVQVTKQGYVFAFNRLTGEPLFNVEERKVPQSSLTGEETWPTQPFPVKPKPFARQSNEISLENISPFAPNKEELKRMLEQANNAVYAPPSLDPVLLLPGYDGGAEWGGAGVDPENGILYVNSNEMPFILRMGKDSLTPAENDAITGKSLYAKYCSVCHQRNREGAIQSGYPSLVGLKTKLSELETKQIIQKGKGMMVGFPQLSDEEVDGLIAFLYDEPDKMEVTSNNRDEYPKLPYRHLGYTKFLDSNGLPAIDPPWGTLHAINMNTGDYVWSITLGDTPGLENKTGEHTGCESYGGPIITENGLLFIAGTKDGFFRIFDRHNGKLLWQYKLPAASFATPATYQVNNKQYIALACGGEKLGTPKGNKIIAFALPDNP